MHADVIRGLPNNGTNNANAIADRYFQTAFLDSVNLVWLDRMQPSSVACFSEHLVFLKINIMLGKGKPPVELVA